MWQGSYEFTVNQWGVGHGGFHSQEILFQAFDRDPTHLVGDPTLIRVVYDCGAGAGRSSTRALLPAVRTMLDELANGSTIDLLVVSHFDKDHVNGLPQLAAEVAARDIHVDRVWAPVLTRLEAIFAIARSGLRGVSRQRYAQLVLEPVATLEGLFDGAEVSEIEAVDEPISFPRGEGRGDGNDAPGEVGVTLTPGSGGRGLVASAQAHAGVRPEPLWEIQPYVVTSPSSAGAEAVREAVRTKYGRDVDGYTLEELLALSDDEGFLKIFHDIVWAQHHARGPDSSISDARTGSNLSSLCVYSGPVSPYDWCHFRGGWKSVDETPQAIPAAPAWLGTGDAGLLGPRSVDAMRAVLTQNRLDRVGICSAPHHGSVDDSDAILWDAMPNVRSVTVEAGRLDGRFGPHHPHRDVLAELGTRNLDTIICVPGHHHRQRDKRMR